MLQAQKKLEDIKLDVMSACDGMKKKSAILSAVTRLGYVAEDATAESGYLNIRIHTLDGYVRIYKNNRREINFQIWRMTEFSYSGIPTFF